MSELPLALSVGDPAGIGPEVSLRALLEAPPRRGCLVFGDAARLERRALELGLRSWGRAIPEALAEIEPGAIAFADVGSVPDSVVAAGGATAEGGRAQLLALEAAASVVQQGRAAALVTGPTSKEAITLAGVSFRGQTEHLARLCGLEDDAVTMLFVGERLRLALVTTHLPIAALPEAITEGRVARAILHLADVLGRLGQGEPRILVCGLNPHAGEGGLFGSEEREVIRPGIDRARRVLSGAGVELLGPLAAEAALRFAAGIGATRRGPSARDGVVAMYHDQATIASKLLDWGGAVNVSWGLPFVRTSVDHGVAYDAVGREGLEHSGMVAALRMAELLLPEARRA